jgi:Domain of unknown function (DUF4192)
MTRTPPSAESPQPDPARDPVSARARPAADDPAARRPGADHPAAGRPAAGRPAAQDPAGVPPPAPGAPAGPGPGRVRLGSAEALLAVVPNLLGFHPSQSLVVLGVSGPRDRVSLTFRYDLPGPDDDDLTSDIAGHASEVLTREAISAVVIVGYGAAGPVERAVAALAAALEDCGVEVGAMLRAESGRYWSLSCPDPDCCPPEGTPFDPCSHPAARLLAEAGLDVLPDRAALARTLQPPPGTAKATRQATGRALRRLGRVVTAAERDGRDSARAVAEAGIAAVREAIGEYRSGAAIGDRGRLAFLAVAVSNLRVRDDAWARMDPAHAQDHLRLWTDLVTGAAPEFVPAPAALLAFTAWQAGEGALANVAAERALAADPAYTMALLVTEAVQAGLPPASARPPLTPDEVADSYAPGAPAQPRGRGPGSTGRRGDKLSEPFAEFGADDGEGARPEPSARRRSARRQHGEAA